MPQAYFDNVSYNASTLNGSASALGATNFSYFSDGESFFIDDLNEITRALVEKGVLLTRGRYTAALSGNTVTVSDGEAVFLNGVRRWDDTSTKFTLLNTETQYVFLLNDPGLRTVSMQLDSALPVGDVLLLATVTRIDGVFSLRVNGDRYARFKAGNPNGTRIPLKVTAPSPVSPLPPGTTVWSSANAGIEDITSKYNLCVIQYRYLIQMSNNIQHTAYSTMVLSLADKVVLHYSNITTSPSLWPVFKYNVPLAEWNKIHVRGYESLSDNGYFMVHIEDSALLLNNGNQYEYNAYSTSIKFF